MCMCVNVYKTHLKDVFLCVCVFKGGIVMNWLKFFEIKDNIDLSDTYRTNINIPKELRELMKMDLRKLEDTGDKVSLNEYMIYLMIIGGNFAFNEKNEVGDRFYRLNNKLNLSNLYKEGAYEMIENAKKEVEIYEKKYQTKKYFKKEYKKKKG